MLQSNWFSSLAVVCVSLTACTIKLSPGSMVVTTDSVSASNLVQGSGKAKTETRPSSNPYSRIDVQIPAEVHITIGNGKKIRITADDNLLKFVHTEITNDVLTIRNNGSYKTDLPIKITIVNPHMEGINIVSSASVKVDDVDEPLLHVTISGSGIVEASGTAPDVDVVVNGSGSVSLADVRAETAHAVVSGSGNIVVNASNSLDAVINGSGTVKYKGDPSIKKNISGSGAVAPFETP